MAGENSWHQDSLAQSVAHWSDEVLQNNIARFESLDGDVGEYGRFVRDTLYEESWERQVARAKGIGEVKQ